MATKDTPAIPIADIPIVCQLNSTVQYLCSFLKDTKTIEVPSILQPKVVKLSPNGKYLACLDSSKFALYEFSEHKIIVTKDFNEKQMLIQEFVFSPKSTYIATYEQYSAFHRENKEPNIKLYQIEPGFELVAVFTHTQSSETWQPQWTGDEQLFVKQTIAGLLFRETVSWSKDSKHKPFELNHLQSFKVAKNSLHSPHFAVFLKGFQSSPCSARIYQHPPLDNPPVVSKAFFNADSAAIHWNHNGTVALFVAHMESAVNYYGGESLYYLSLQGETLSVELDKKGPIYSVDWHPTLNQFAVVYGLMPSSARIYDHKCQPLITLPPLHRNVVKYNPQGNLLCFAGFGGLKGVMEFWNVKTRLKLSEAEAVDTTYCEWCPDGERFLTATLSPRLFEGNGFRVWDFRGKLLAKYSIPEKDHLWSITWRPAPVMLPAPSLDGAKGVFFEKADSYVPPGLRDRRPADINEKPRDKKKEKECNSKVPVVASESVQDMNVKKIRNLRRKLKDIEKLKQLVSNGGTLEATQLAKIERESEIIAQVELLEKETK